jgi:hypothetical protein
MAKTTNKSRKKSLNKDYEEVLKSQPMLPNVPSVPQWRSHGDYFKKFSLYEETTGIASPSTSLPQIENA